MNLLDFQKEYAADLLKMFEAPKWSPYVKLEDLSSSKMEEAELTKLVEFNKWIIKTAAEKEGRDLFEGQLQFVAAPQVWNFINGSNAGIIAAKMGTGKTTMSNSIAYLLYKREYEIKNKGMKVMFLTAGSKHLKKMKREAEATLPKNTDIYIVRSQPRKTIKHEITAEEAALLPRVPGRITYIILSKDTGKNTYKFKAMKEGMKCPKCSTRLGGKDKIGKKEIFSCGCGEKTYQAISGTPSIGEVYRKIAGPKTNKLFDFLIVDEVHEMQNPTSLQSLMYQSLIRVSYRTLVMTGTLSNGYASSIFYILYPLLAKHFKQYGGFDYNKVGTFVDFFGSKRETATVKFDSNGSRRRSVKVEELPQINDRIVSFLAPFTTWFSMEDLNVEMPEFHEFIRIVDMDQEIKDQFKEWGNRVAAAANLVRNYNLMHFKAAVHYRVNNPTNPYIQTIKGERVFTEYDENNATESIQLEEVEYEIPFTPLPKTFRSKKELEMISIVKSEIAEGRRVMIYGVYNQSTNLYERLLELLTEEGISCGYLPDNIKSEDIEEWITKFEGDVLILPQKRVATGLDLVMFHTVLFYEMDNQLRIVQQAKVRPWRPVGQDKEVRVFYLAYAGQQEKDLKSMAQKMRAAATVEGEIIDNESIAAIYDYNPELTAAIAEITNDIKSGEIDSNLLRRDLSDFEEEYKKQLELNRALKAKVTESTNEDCEEDEEDNNSNNNGGNNNGGNTIIKPEVNIESKPFESNKIEVEEKIAALNESVETPKEIIEEENITLIDLDIFKTDSKSGQMSFAF